jgi:hypothetical protein
VRQKQIWESNKKEKKIDTRYSVFAADINLVLGESFVFKSRDGIIRN